MSTQLKLRGGTTAQHSSFTGAAKEVTVDTDKKTLVVHDGSTAGGFPLMKESGSSSTGVWSLGANHIYKDASGNIGIGTSSPGGKLDVTGSSGTVRVESGGDSLAFLKNGLNYISAKGGSSGVLVFETGAAGERMRIASTGELLINTTDTTLYNNTSGYGVCFRTNASLDVLSTNDNCVILNRTGTDGPIEEFRKSGTIVGSISVTGSTTAYNTSSDYRLKENVAPIQNALNVVQQLKPVTYNWKVDGSNGQGFIAHELQAVVPECVTGEKDATRIEQYEIEPAKTVMVTRQRQKTIKVMAKQHKVDCIDGVYTACVHDVEIDQPVFEQHPLFNQDGSPVMDVNNPEQQAMIDVPVMEDYEAEEEIPAVIGEREVPAYQGIDTSFLVATLTSAIQELKAELDATKAEVEALKVQ